MLCWITYQHKKNIRKDIVVHTYYTRDQIYFITLYTVKKYVY